MCVRVFCFNIKLNKSLEKNSDTKSSKSCKPIECIKLVLSKRIEGVRIYKLSCVFEGRNGFTTFQSSNQLIIKQKQKSPQFVRGHRSRV